jgi:hypothetical protein
LKKKVPIVQTKKETQQGSVDIELSCLDIPPEEIEKKAVVPQIEEIKKEILKAEVPKVTAPAPQVQVVEKEVPKAIIRDVKPAFERRPFIRETKNPNATLIEGIDVFGELGKIKGKLKANLYSQGAFVESILVKDLIKAIKEKKNISMIIFDGIVTKRLAEMAKGKGIKELVGVKVGKMSKIKGINITSLE